MSAWRFSGWMILWMTWGSLGFAASLHDAASNVPYIEVTAEAEARAAPDLALIEFAVVTRAETAAAAAQQNAVRMKTVLAGVRQSVGQGAQIGTGAYSLRAEYAQSREAGEPRVAAYVASNVVRLETAEMARLGDVIDAAIKAGANQVQRVSFGLSDPAAVRRDALRDAVTLARSDAETMAAALKVGLGPVLSLSNQDGGPVRPFMQEAMVARQALASTPIEPGQVSVRARVTLRILIAK